MGKHSVAWRLRVLDWLASQVPEARLSHILRVEQMSTELAQLHGLDDQKAAQAGLLHDLAKYFKAQRLLDIAQQAGLSLDPVDRANPHLLHADVSAIVARDEFGVDDPEILAAIANHTLGHPDMDALSCVVYLADGLEPGRGDSPELQHLRQVSRENLEQAVWLTCDYTLKYLIQTQRLIHPRAISTRNGFMQRSISQQRLQSQPLLA